MTERDILRHVIDITGLNSADISPIFGVDRRTVLVWLSGSGRPDDIHAGRMDMLRTAAERFAAAELPRSGNLFRMKTFDGRSLIDLMGSGENTAGHVDFLIDEGKRMKDAYERVRRSNRRGVPTDDWKSYISIPGSFE